MAVTQWRTGALTNPVFDAVERASGSRFVAASVARRADVTMIGAIVLIVLLAAGCTSESSAPSTTSESTTSTTSSPTSTTASTTSLTTTTVDPVAEAEAAVEAAYFRSYDVFIECYITLPDCDPPTAFADVFTGDLYRRLSAVALEDQSNNLIYEMPENPDHARAEVYDISLNDDLTEATVSFCTISDHPEFVINPDGSRTRSDDENTILVEWGDAEFVLESDDVWRLKEYPEDIGDVVNAPLSNFDRQLEEGVICANRPNA